MLNPYTMTCDFKRIAEFKYKCIYCEMEVTSYNAGYPVMLCNKKLLHYGSMEQYGMMLQPVANEPPPPSLPDTIEEKPKKEKKIPGIISKILNFGKAATKHAVAGSPKCTEKEIAERYNICKSCEFFSDNTCTKCGCNLVREQVYMNKLAWADQSCPIGKWKAIPR
jgi:hypothetical protein